MGQKQSSQSKPVQPQSQSTLDHPRFNRARLYNDKNGQYIQIEVPIANEAEILNWEKQFKPLVQHECLLLPLSYQLKKTEFCGSSGLSKINYDNYPFILKKQIQDRSTQPIKPFENHELWYLIYNLLESTYIFHAKRQKVGDIRPLNVFINQDGQIKIANQYTWPHELNNYQKSLHEKQITFLAPEQIKNIFFGSEKTEDLQLAQSFSVGLTLLDSVNLTNSQDLYNVGNYRLDYQGLQRRKGALKSNPHIDNTIRQLILSLTATNHIERLKSSQAFSWLTQYRQNISNMQPFEIREAPSWLRNQGLNNKNTSVKMVRDVPFFSDPKSSSGFRMPEVIHQEKIRTQFMPLNVEPTVSQRIIYHNVQYNPQVPVQQKVEQVKFTPLQFIPPQNKSPIKIGIQQNQVYESSYIPVPYQYPISNGLRSDDFKSTLTKIQQQLQASRKLFPS